jgi:hypothetical protein
MAFNPGHSAGQGPCPQVRHLHGRLSHKHTRVAVKAAMLCVEPTAPAWTTSDQQPRPTPTRPAATTVTTADPIAALRRPLRLPTLKPAAPCPVARAHQVAPAFSAVPGYGPAYPTDSARSWRDGRIDGGWYYAKVLWLADPVSATRTDALSLLVRLNGCAIWTRRRTRITSEPATAR